ncbi:hypothetical protein LCGC14_2527960, partial [marine sediment metagenome]
GIVKIVSQDGGIVAAIPQETVNLIFATIAAVSIVTTAAIAYCCVKMQNKPLSQNVLNQNILVLFAPPLDHQETIQLLDHQDTSQLVETTKNNTKKTKKKRFANFKKWIKKPLVDKLKDLSIIIGFISGGAKIYKKRIKPLVKRRAA